MTLIDPYHEKVTVEIYVGNQEVTGSVVWNQCQFESSASAMPGTCTLVLRDHEKTLSFTPGQVYGVIRLVINGQPAWTGYLMTVEQGYFFPDKRERKWTLRGVDLNIVFDKLRMWNRTDPTYMMDGGGHYTRDSNGIVKISPNELAATYVGHMLQDTDFYSVQPTLTTSFGDDLGYISESYFSPPKAGLSLRDFMINTAANINRMQQGSIVWYINPSGQFVFRLQDTDAAPWSIGDDSNGVNVKNLVVTTDISSIKNNVIIFTGDLSPDPNSTQQYLLYKKNELTASVNQFGRFQWSEVLGNSWSQAMINARSTKVLYQESTPKMTASFTTYRSGLYPGQILTISSNTHTYHTWNESTSVWQNVSSFNIPIRAVSYRFVTPSVIEYSVTCSYDTQDPWGLLLALKRPPSVGLVPPTFQVVDWVSSPNAQYQDRPVYTFVREWAKQGTGGVWETTYGYIRYSLAVYVDGLRLSGVSSPDTTTGFIETDPENGKFKLGQGVTGKPMVEYHVLRNKG